MACGPAIEARWGRPAEEVEDIDRPQNDEEKRIAERLKHEVKVIETTGFVNYFLVVWDFIHYAHGEKIPVGPGRGSGAGSLVAYALTITDLDPLRFNLVFERFLNPERVSMPDFDIDFCMEGRDRVIDYVAQTYGRDQVSQIITYGSMAAKAVVRDCGRVLGHGYGFVDSIAKLIPPTLGMTLKDALAEEPQLKQRYDEEEDTRAVIDLAMSLEGIRRNAGKHAGGVVIAPSRLTDFTPLFCEAGGGSVVPQFDKDDVETIGLVKFDFLGLRTLTIIDWAVEAINRQREARREDPLCIERIPMDDPAAFELLKRQETTAVFQLESRGMKDLIKRLQPDVFDDIVALVALFRPGPLQSGMVDDFINRKHGRNQEPIDYFHPSLEPILKPTYGVILYQEQVMQIAQELAGYSLGEADLLRRAMGKKIRAEMDKQRVRFVEGAVERGVQVGAAEQEVPELEPVEPEAIAEPMPGADEGQALWEEMLAVALATKPGFLLNVTLNQRRQITGVFAGDLVEAHRAGAAFVGQSALQPVPEAYVARYEDAPCPLALPQGAAEIAVMAFSPPVFTTLCPGR